jgi:photosystem II stability/assembly factor-like uncharacterized protein
MSKSSLARVVPGALVLCMVASGCEEPTDRADLDEASAEVAVADGGVPRRSSWSYWDRGGDLGVAWRAESFDDGAWARGAGPLGYGESYLGTTIGYGGDAAHKHVTTYFRTQFTLANPAAVTAIRGDLMFDDGVVVYLNGQEIGRAALPTGTLTAATLASGHEAGNAYRSYDWTAQKPHLHAGVNTIAVEIHQQASSSSDLVFDLGLVITAAPSGPRTDDLARNSVWAYWDRGGDLGSAWRGAAFDDSGWARGEGPLGYGESYLRTTLGYGPDPAHKNVTAYFRNKLWIDDPARVTRMLIRVMHDDGFVVYINGQEFTRFSMPSGPITASTLAQNWESGNQYESYEWTPSVIPFLGAGENVIAVEVHQASPASSDLTFDLEITTETSTREPTTRGIPAGSTWGYWDRATSPGSTWRDRGYPETGWRAGAAPLGYGESYVATPTAPGHVTTYFRHDFYRWGSPTDWVLEAKYDDGFVASLNGTEVLRVGLPAGPLTETTLARSHEAGGYERFALPGASALTIDGLNTLAIEVHQNAASSSDLVWDARLVAESPWPVAWQRQASGTDRTLTDVWFTDAMRGWVVGNGTVLRTVDGGATWTPQAIGDGTWLFAVQFVDAQHGWLVGSDATFATTDGGATWNPQPVRGRSVSFISPTIGWISGPSIYRTVDGGATWNLQLDGTGNISYGRVDFVDAMNGWAIARVDAGGDDGHFNGENLVVHTTDGGVTWHEQLGVGGWEQALIALDAVDPTFACVVGNGSNHQTLGELGWLTRDGATWEAMPSSANDTALFDVQFLDAHRAWAVGYAGSLIHTTDGGASWSVQETARWQYIPDHTEPAAPSLNAVHFIDASTGWAVGDDGTILHTTRGGLP